MEATSTIDMRPATSSEMRAYTRHVEHDPNEIHANKMIVESDRELNRYHVINDEKTALNDQYKEYLDMRNEKLEDDFEKNKISLEQYTSRKQTVQEYVNGSNGSKEKKAYTSAVLTVADVDTQRDMLDKLGWSYKMIGVGKQDANGKYENYRAQLTDKSQRETWAQLWDMTYTQTAKDISNESLRAISVMTNLDEGGGAHAHVKFLNMGLTDKNKPSTTMNGALKSMYGYKDSRANLRQFRTDYDPIMIANFNNAAQALNLDLNLDMVRTREAGSVDMPTYKANKKKEAELKQYEAVLKGRKKRLDKKNQEVDKKNQEADRKNQEALKKQQELAGQQEYIRLIQQDTERTNRASIERKQEFDKQKKEQEKQQKLLKLQQREQAEREAAWPEKAKDIVNKAISEFLQRTDLRKWLEQRWIEIQQKRNDKYYTATERQQRVDRIERYTVKKLKNGVNNVANKAIDWDARFGVDSTKSVKKQPKQHKKDDELEL